jgi:hypothetical protein
MFYNVTKVVISATSKIIPRTVDNACSPLVYVIYNGRSVWYPMNGASRRC